MSAPKIPPLPAPLLGLPPAAGLVLLTGVLGASANWLLLRWACALLLRRDGDVAVVLVSFMRGGGFWRDAAAKMVSSPLPPVPAWRRRLGLTPRPGA